MNKEQLSAYVTLMACATLTLILLSMVGVLLVGLFNPIVDNTKIFEAITPAFQTIVGGFIGLITGIKIGTDEQLSHREGMPNLVILWLSDQGIMGIGRPKDNPSSTLVIPPFLKTQYVLPELFQSILCQTQGKF